MSTGGLLLMLIGLVGMTALLGWCIYKVLATPGSAEHLHSPLDIDTGDRNDRTTQR